MMIKDNNKHLVSQLILQQIPDFVPCQHFCLFQFPNRERGTSHYYR